MAFKMSIEAIDGEIDFLVKTKQEDGTIDVKRHDAKQISELFRVLDYCDKYFQSKGRVYSKYN